MILLYTMGIAISGGKPRASGDDPGESTTERKEKSKPRASGDDPREEQKMFPEYV